MKRCPKCKKEKESILEFWHKSNQTKDGFQGHCKVCRSKAKKIYRDINKTRINKQTKEYYKNNIEEIRKKAKKYRQLESTKERVKKWGQENKIRLREYKSNWIKNKYQKNPTFRLSSCFSSLLRQNLKKNKLSKEGNRAFELVPYSLEDLIIHLENQFDENMTWENYGSYWHIDHIKPQAGFLFESYEDREFKQCWALKNLRPLEAGENLRKGSKTL